MMEKPILRQIRFMNDDANRFVRIGRTFTLKGWKLVSLEILFCAILALVLGGMLFCSISNGFIFGQVSGMLNALYSREDGIVLNDDDISWIASSVNITSVLGFAFAAIITGEIGRKWAFTLFSVPIIMNWVMLYYAEDMIIFMISRMIVGICFGGVLSMYAISIAEYTCPNVRGLFLSIINSVGLALGTALGHFLGILYHWRIVALIGIIPTTLGAIWPFFSEESPSWLASKGKFEECDKVFRRLHGHRPDAEKELQVLKEIEKCKRESVNTETKAYVLRKFYLMCKKKYFWNLILLSSVINIYLAAAGKLLYSTLAITMMENITGSKDVMLFTLIIDIFVILGACLSCVLIKKLKMRTLLFTTGVIANVLLVILSASLYFYPEKGGYNTWINCIVLALYFIIVNVGPYPVLEAFIGEMFPLELKAYCFFLSGIVLSISMFLSVKLADDLFRTFGYHGTFLFNTLVMSACLGYIWFRMPETKGRTMQEIELYFKNNTFNEVEKILNGKKKAVFV